MIKVLYAPFYSMRSYKTTMWLLQRDGHATRCRNIVHLLCQKYNDVNFDIIIPTNNDIDNSFEKFFGKFDTSEYVDRVRLLVNPFYAHNTVSERMNFPYKFFKEVLANSNYDVVIYENIENARYMKNLMLPHARLISSITHSPATEDTIFLKHNNFLLRIIDGLYASDAVFYNTSYIFNNMDCILSKHFPNDIAILMDKLKASYAYTSSYEMGSIDDVAAAKEKGSVLFMSRFSDADRTKVNDFINLVKDYKSDKYRFYITNPSEAILNMDMQNLLDRDKLTLLPQHNRRDWKDILQRMEMVVILYDVEKCYSTGYFEAALNKCKIITQSHKSWMYKLNEHIYPLSDDIEQALDSASTCPPGKNYLGCKVSSNDFTVEHSLNKLASIILCK
jgi:hypothetical protein